MKTYLNPPEKAWAALTQRPNLDLTQLNSLVKDVFEDVQKRGKGALFEYTEKFDKVKLDNLKVEQTEIESAKDKLSEELKKAIQTAYHNIKKFHESQVLTTQKVVTTEGVSCWRENRAIEKVGFYIPGGSAPLFSTVLMLGIPAKIAGCKQVVLCSPPQKDGSVHPAILYAAKLVGVSSIFKLGGIQAIAAMNLGIGDIPKVYKIFGPGNQYVMAAKQFVQNRGTAIDMPAGPSEVLVIADDTANPQFVAADLLSQAEHGPDSQVVLLSDSEVLIKAVLEEVKVQLEKLPRQEIATKALDNSKAVLFENIDNCFAFSNNYAPEHLIVAVENAEDYTPNIVNAGSVFLGNYSCESAGDYASGTNHTLPTNGYAKAYSGVSVDSFVKKITFQRLEQKGVENIGKAIEIMAEAEGLQAHKNAMTLRLEYLFKKES